MEGAGAGLPRTRRHGGRVLTPYGKNRVIVNVIDVEVEPMRGLMSFEG